MKSQRSTRKASRTYHRGHRVLVVKCPEGWKPRSVSDIPPNVEIHSEDSPHEADGFRDGFNETQLSAPTGWWAIV